MSAKYAAFITEIAARQRLEDEQPTLSTHNVKYKIII